MYICQFLGSYLNASLLGQVLKHLQRDPTSVTEMKTKRVIIIVTYYLISTRNHTEKNGKILLKLDLSLIFLYNMVTVSLSTFKCYNEILAHNFFINQSNDKMFFSRPQCFPVF